MSSILREIQELLLGGIDSEKVIKETSTYFYETIEECKKRYPQLEHSLITCNTLEEYFNTLMAQANEELQETAADLQEDIAYALEDTFDRVEDDVKHEMLKGKLASKVLQDIKEQGIILAARPGRREKPSEDEVEEFYVEAFEQFDALHVKLWEYILQLSPQAYYNQGKMELEVYRQAHGLLMDAKEFNEHYAETFDKQRLWDLLAQKVYESIHYNRRYILEEPEISEDDEDFEEESEEESYEANEKDAVLIGAEDFDPEEFGFVYELMEEYTGRRVLPSENEWGEEAYWLTYADDFAELLGIFMISQLENTIRYFVQERPHEYDSFAKFYHWNQEQREDPEVILTSCDKISYYLTDFQESLWNEFTEAKLQPFYEKGRALAKES